MIALLLALSASGGQVFLGGHHLGPAPEPGPLVAQPALFGTQLITPRWDPDLPPAPDEAPPARQELVFLSTQALVGGSRVLPVWRDLRQAEGWSVRVATEADWDHPVASGRDDRAMRIRAWLQEEYADSPGAFLLLAGDPSPETGDVPMALVHPMAEVVQYYPDLSYDMDPVPTDFLYAELSASWDSDGDGRLGEYPDDQRDVDWGPELYVGRLPVYDGSSADLDHLLSRAIQRDLETDKAYRHHALLPGALFAIAGAPAPDDEIYTEHSDGAAVQDALWWDLPRSFGATRLFEQDGLVTSVYEDDLPLSLDNVLTEWEPGHGLVVWSGHGSPDGAWRMVWEEDHDHDGWASWDEMDYPPLMESRWSGELVDTPGAFVAHVSCSNGVPEDPDNIGTALLYGGAVGTFSASRVAFGVTADWGESWVPRPDLATATTVSYYVALNLAEGWTAGESLAWTKYALPGDWDGYPAYGWYTKLQFHLYGDPTRSLELCELDADCDDGSPCDGFETCDAGACVHHEPVSCAHLDDACSVGVCDDTTGACEVEARADGSACDDGLWCTEDDTCLAGECEGVARDCGHRDGYASTCLEAEQECEMTPLAEEEEPGGCSHTGGALPWLVLLGGGLGLGWRRRAWINP